MKQNQLSKQLLGKRGEDLAATYLQKLGYHILDRNFRARPGELDIVALHHKTLIFIEVKTRIDTAFGTPEEAVTPHKLREVIKTAQYYRMLHPDAPDSMRIDVIGIQMDELGNVISFRHIESVTS